MPTSSPDDRVPKILGGDVELGNFLLGIDTPGGSGFAASRGLLREIPGVASERRLAGSLWLATLAGSAAPANAQDWGRVFLRSNGGCCYIDSDHLEVALPETRSAYDYV